MIPSEFLVNSVDWDSLRVLVKNPGEYNVLTVTVNISPADGVILPTLVHTPGGKVTAPTNPLKLIVYPLNSYLP
jgi:hypothetical protein